MINAVKGIVKDRIIKSWWLSNSTGVKDTVVVNDGLLTYKGNVLYVYADELKYQVKSANELKFHKLKSVKNFPKEPGVKTISCFDAGIQAIDQQINCVKLDLSHNQLTSLSGIHKLVTCEVIDVTDNPVEDSILGLLMIPGIMKIHHRPEGYGYDWWVRENCFDLHKALQIVARHVGKGKAGVLAAQQELIDADLDRFASL